jgi:hypothetical protein
MLIKHAFFLISIRTQESNLSDGGGNTTIAG